MNEFLQWLTNPADDAWFGAFCGIFVMWLSITVILSLKGRRR